MTGQRAARLRPEVRCDLPGDHRSRTARSTIEVHSRPTDLTLSIATINAWNRLSIAARLTPGTYGDAT